MSWLSSLVGGKEPEPYVEPSDTPKVPDPSMPNRMVSTKSANQPFLAYKEYREKQEAVHNAWLERKKIREEKLARGEPVGPEEEDPTAEKEIGLLGILKFFLYLLIVGALAGKFITGSYTWDYESKWLKLRTYWPEVSNGEQMNSRLFSERALAEFDGSVPGRPIYLAIDGDVYDVTAGKAYQPGGSYAIMTGVDAARAFATGCFKTHRTHDLRGLTEQQLNSIQHWKKFYAEHKDYFKVGRVSHSPIDPASPIPEPCDPKTGMPQGKRNDRATTKDAKQKDPAKVGPQSKGSGSDEL